MHRIKGNNDDDVNDDNDDVTGLADDDDHNNNNNNNNNNNDDDDDDDDDDEIGIVSEPPVGPLHGCLLADWFAFHHGLWAQQHKITFLSYLGK